MSELSMCRTRMDRDEHNKAQHSLSDLAAQVSPYGSAAGRTSGTRSLTVRPAATMQTGGAGQNGVLGPQLSIAKPHFGSLGLRGGGCNLLLTSHLVSMMCKSANVYQPAQQHCEFSTPLLSTAYGNLVPKQPMFHHSLPLVIYAQRQHACPKHSPTIDVW